VRKSKVPARCQERTWRARIERLLNQKEGGPTLLGRAKPNSIKVISGAGKKIFAKGIAELRVEAFAVPQLTDGISFNVFAEEGPFRCGGFSIRKNLLYKGERGS